MFHKCIACPAPPDEAFDSFAQSCLDAGFAAIALILTDQGGLNLDSDRASCEQAAALLRQRGVHLAALSSTLFHRHNFASAHAESRRLAEQITEALLQRAAWLGASLVYVGPASVGPVDPGGDFVSYEDALGRCFEGLAARAENAERWGVCLAVAAPLERFLLSPLEVRDLVDRLNSPAIGVAVQLDEAAGIGYAADWLRILSYRVKCLLTTSELDEGVVRALREIRFDGPLIC